MYANATMQYPISGLFKIQTCDCGAIQIFSEYEPICVFWNWNTQFYCMRFDIVFRYGYHQEDMFDAIPVSCDDDGYDQCYVLRNIRNNEFIYYSHLFEKFHVGTVDIDSATKFVFKSAY